MMNGDVSKGMRQGVCVVLIDLNKKCALVSRPDGKTFGLPGGKLEPGENFAQAARRELWEETGLLVNTEDLIPLYRGVCDATASDGHSYDVMTFISLAWSGEMMQKEINIKPSWGSLVALADPDVSPFAPYNASVIAALASKFPSLLPARSSGMAGP